MSLNSDVLPLKASTTQISSPEPGPLPAESSVSEDIDPGMLDTGAQPEPFIEPSPDTNTLAKSVIFSLDRPLPLDSKLFPDRPTEGSHQLPGTIRNTEYLLNKYKIITRYNVIKKKLMINVPGHMGTIDNEDSVTLTRILSLAVLNGLSTKNIPAFIEAIADMNMYNPVAEWIFSRPWDGKDRRPYICETITERECSASVGNGHSSCLH